MSKNQRIMECQADCHSGFIYSQGCIDMAIDILDNIDRIKAATKKEKNGTEIV
jgi:hypothetical protein